MLRRTFKTTTLALVFAATTACDHFAPPPSTESPTVRSAPIATNTSPTLSIDSRISDLMANPSTRPIMDRHLPRLADNPHYAMLEDSTLRDLAPISNGKLTEDVLAKFERELAAAQSSDGTRR
jgi:hypothetical protein